MTVVTEEFVDVPTKYTQVGQIPQRLLVELSQGKPLVGFDVPGPVKTARHKIKGVSNMLINATSTNKSISEREMNSLFETLLSLNQSERQRWGVDRVTDYT